MGGRRYEIEEVDLTGSENAVETVIAAVKAGSERDIVRIILKGQYGGEIDVESIENALQNKYYSVAVRNRTVPVRDIWTGCGEDSLTGLFLSRMKQKYDEASTEEERETVTLAVKCALAALEMGEGAAV